MIKFSKKVDLRNREAMTSFLKDHYRYFTANSWNRGTSYAHNVKVYNLGLPSDVVDKLYEIMDTEDGYYPINDLIEDFAINHDYKYQVGFNGRSSGYLVLYTGGLDTLDYKSYCKSCGQLNYTSVEDTGCKCGKCKQETRVNLTSPIKRPYTTAASIDADEDFSSWSMDELRERVKLVQDFDLLCDDVVAEAKYLADNYTVVDEEYTEVKTRKVLCAVS